MIDYGEVYETWDADQHERLSEVIRRLDIREPLFTGFPTVHVAGTNGKGSVCAMTASVLKRAGYRTGLFTSPHLYCENERIMVDGEPIPHEILTEYLDEIYRKYPDLRLFDGYFYAALKWFARCKVDIAVMETGLGGSMDCTNILLPRVSAIATIAMDHSDILGNTLQEIAAQKAGIAKPHVPMALYPGGYPAEVDRVIRNRCGEVGAPVASYGPGELTISHSGDGFYAITVKRDGLVIPDIPVPLMGEHQSYNAALAVLICLELGKAGFSIEPKAISEGIAAARHPGRMERISTSPVTILDGAHNPEGAGTLAAAIRRHYAGRKVVLLTAMMSNKDVSGAADALRDLADEVITTQVDSPRAMSAEELAAVYGGNTVWVKDPVEAYQLARERCPEDGVLLVTGSLYLPHAIGLMEG